MSNLRGHILLEVNDSFPERFVNLCAQNGAAFWGVTKIDTQTIRLYMLPGGYRRIQNMTKRFNIKIIKEKGVPFFMGRMRKRYALWAGLFVFFALVYIFNRFIWEFEIDGNHMLSNGVILQNLKEIGITVGTYHGDLDMTEIKNEMIMRLENLSWIGVNIRGGKAYVTVKERVAPPEVLSSVPGNIIAGKDGVLVRLDTFAGSARVSAGESVKKGDLLVSGVTDIPNYGARLVRAQGAAYARTWRDMSAFTPLSIEEKEYTGKYKTRSALVVAGKRLNLYSEKNQAYERYDKSVKRNVFTLPGGVVLPFSIETETLREYKTLEAETDSMEAEWLLNMTLTEALDNSFSDGEIEERNIIYEKKDDKISARLTAEVIENIAVTADMP